MPRFSWRPPPCPAALLPRLLPCILPSGFPRPRTALWLPRPTPISPTTPPPPQMPCNLSPTPQETGSGSRVQQTPPPVWPPPLPQFPLSWYLTWSVLPKWSGTLGTPGPASLSCPCPGTTRSGPLRGRPSRVSEPRAREPPATWPRSPGMGCPGRAPGQLWSPGVCFLPSLSTLLCVCVFSLASSRKASSLLGCLLPGS